MILSILSIIFFGLCFFAAITDARSLRIPNWINLAIAALFIPAAIAAYLSGQPLTLLVGHLTAGVITFVICFGLFAVGVIGGGDAKMLPAVMLWVGPVAVLDFILMMTVVGGVLAIVIMMGRNLVPAEIMPSAIRAPFEQRYVPYGVAIAGGALLGGSQSLILTDLLSQLNNFH